MLYRATLSFLLGGYIYKESGRPGILSAASHLELNPPSLAAVSSRLRLLLSFDPTAGPLKRSVYIYFTRLPPHPRNHQYSYQLITLSLQFWRTDTGLRKKK